MKRVLVVCNPYAGGGHALDVLAKVKEFAFSQTDLRFGFYETTKSNDTDGVHHAIVQNDPEIISIVGGDGTINDVLNVDEARIRNIHLIPGGSGNDFSRLIHGDLTSSESILMLQHFVTKPFDVGICNNRFFLNGVGIGFDGSVARETVKMNIPFISTSWKYWLAILKNVLFYRSTKITIEVDGLKETKKRFMVAVANGTDYGGGFKISPSSIANDGYLNLVSIGDIVPLSRLFKIPLVKNGKHLNEDFVEHRTIKQVVVSAENELHAHLDGELMSSVRFEIDIQPKVSFIIAKPSL